MRSRMYVVPVGTSRGTGYVSGGGEE
jgi:hypothetical protein